jgi:putative Ca2+/H+ antiporter (TMEM165/GDT1 family)
MRDMLGVFLALALLTIGAALFSGGISKSDLSQTARMISGAAFLSFGLISSWFAVKDWLKWRRQYKE